MDNIEVLIDEETIKNRIKELGRQISSDYEGEELILVCILKGSVYISCELSRCITVPIKLDFLSVSSYGDSTESQGIVKIIKDLDENIKDKNILIVEDIIDTGRTLSFLVDMLKTRLPKSVALFTLLDKPDRRLENCSVTVDYSGFIIPDRFVVGYGMDYAQQYRNLPYVGVVVE